VSAMAPAPFSPQLDSVTMQAPPNAEPGDVMAYLDDGPERLHPYWCQAMVVGKCPDGKIQVLVDRASVSETHHGQETPS